jgi:hypothetical protein
MLHWISICGGLLIMMGHQARSESLFYYFRLEDHVPENHLLRLIDKHISFEFVREQLKNSYSDTGRPSVDPELLLRILLIGYLGPCSDADITLLTSRMQGLATNPAVVEVVGLSERVWSIGDKSITIVWISLEAALSLVSPFGVGYDSSVKYASQWIARSSAENCGMRFALKGVAKFDLI